MKDHIVIGYENGKCLVLDEEDNIYRIDCGDEEPYPIGTVIPGLMPGEMERDSE